MRMREIRIDGQPPVEGYGPGGFRIRGEWHAGAVLITAAGVRPAPDPGGDAAAGELTALAGEVDLVLIGQGAEIAPLALPLRRALEAAGIGVEHMATPPACRTYNVLLTEGRRVAVLLVPV
jgi:uncharacterized protein